MNRSFVFTVNLFARTQVSQWIDSLITTIRLVVSRSWPLFGWMTALIPIATSVYYQFVNLFAKLMESAGSELIDSGIPQSVITCLRGRDVINTECCMISRRRHYLAIPSHR